MKTLHMFILLCMACMGYAQAEIYKQVDAEGHVTYSSTPTKGAVKLNLEPLPTVQPPVRTRDTSPSNFPRVDNNTQKNRDEGRRRILADELATEEKLLDEAKKNLKEGEEKPEVYRGPDGKTYRNMAKYEEKIKTLQEQVILHEKNIEALKSELSKLR
jgi:hypothetical protein